MLFPRVVPVIVLLLLAPVRASAQSDARPAPPEALAYFEAKVRPVLVTHCIPCHGAKKQSGDLRLDARAELLKIGARGPIVVPGDPERSVLIQAIRHDGKLKMPQKGKLPEEAIAHLVAWVKMGAPWPMAAMPRPAASGPKHWAFEPVRAPGVPTPAQSGWGCTPVDAFILAGLEAKKLRPSGMADRRTLIRRVTFDLVGLPPTPREVEEFLSDAGPGAFARVVDRLLSSPHYGERWGRHWLDVARYADTKGYVFFEEADFPWAWTYRDYVIRAFNADLPYDRFILEQLAADQLAAPIDPRSLTALGFLSLGGRFMNNVHDVIDDRIDVVTRGLMGLTVTCARCHDHKFDPIPQKDYYSLYGVFANCVEPTIPPLFEPPPPGDVYLKFETELRVRERALTEFVRAKHAELVLGARRRVAEYLLAAHALRDQPSTDDFMLIAGTNDLNPTMIVRWQKYLERAREAKDPVFAPWHVLAALEPQDFGQAAAAAIGKLTDGPRRVANPIVARALAAAPPKDLAEVAQRYAAVLQGIAKATRTAGPLANPDEEELRQVFDGPDAPANVALLPYGDLSLLPDRASQGKLQALRKSLEHWRLSGAGAPPRAMVLQDVPTPTEPYVFLRGNPSNKGPRVPRQLPLLLAGKERRPFTHGSGRLELAQAIVRPDNPFTARVIVNRVWQHHFGQGLVSTPSDFGLRSDPPSHPELLDWLAARFVADGWSLKKLHRLIVLSAAYRQKSEDRPDCVAADPGNRLLWKAPRRRLDFESTRDAVLAVAGRLDRTIGGPSVRNGLAPGATRRTVYAFLDRLNMPGLFRTFDFPAPDATSPQREDTTVAPQALFLMNHPLVLECACRVVGRPEIAGEKEAAHKVGRIYELLLGRPPAPSELRMAMDYVGSAADAGAAWERYVHALIQTNEFVWVD